jgi:hypothetical protein
MMRSQKALKTYRKMPFSSTRHKGKRRFFPSEEKAASSEKKKKRKNPVR